MELTIITPKSYTTYSIAWLECNTTDGNIVIHKGHAPDILLLAPYTSIIFKLKTGKQQSILVHKGIAEITRQDVALLIQDQ